jgi:hypothetical protein
MGVASGLRLLVSQRWYHKGCVFPYMASVMVALDVKT